MPVENNLITADPRDLGLPSLNDATGVGFVAIVKSPDNSTTDESNTGDNTVRGFRNPKSPLIAVATLEPTPNFTAPSATDPRLGTFVG